MQLQPYRPPPELPAPSADIVPPRVAPHALPAESELEETYCAAYALVHDRVLDFAERSLNRMDAEDAVQNAALKVWKRWAELKPAQRTFAYFLSAVRTCVVDMARSARPEVSLEDADDEIHAFAARETVAPRRGMTADEVLDIAIAAMPPKRRAVMVLMRDQQLTYKEVGQVLRVAESTVANTYADAVADLREAYARAGFRLVTEDHKQLPSEIASDSSSSPVEATDD